MSTQNPLDLIQVAAIGPWEYLNRALAEQKAVETTNSDEAQAARRLAAEIRRLADLFGLDNRDLARNSTEWAMVSSVADASRNRLLSTAARRTTLAATSHFEADEQGNYRFINNRIGIAHPTAGTIDFLTTAAGAIEFLIKELGLEIEWTPEIHEGPPVFGPAVVLDAGPDPNRVFESLQIRFSRRDLSGKLVRFDPSDWQLELKTTGTRGRERDGETGRRGEGETRAR